MDGCTGVFHEPVNLIDIIMHKSAAWLWYFTPQSFLQQQIILKDVPHPHENAKSLLSEIV